MNRYKCTAIFLGCILFAHECTAQELKWSDNLGKTPEIVAQSIPIEYDCERLRSFSYSVPYMNRKTSVIDHPNWYEAMSGSYSDKSKLFPAVKLIDCNLDKKQNVQIFFYQNEAFYIRLDYIRCDRTDFVVGCKHEMEYFDWEAIDSLKTEIVLDKEEHSYSTNKSELFDTVRKINEKYLFWRYFDSEACDRFAWLMRGERKLKCEIHFEGYPKYFRRVVFANYPAEGWFGNKKEEVRMLIQVEFINPHIDLVAEKELLKDANVFLFTAKEQYFQEESDKQKPIEREKSIMRSFQ